MYCTLKRWLYCRLWVKNLVAIPGPQIWWNSSTWVYMRWSLGFFLRYEGDMSTWFQYISNVYEGNGWFPYVMGKNMDGIGIFAAQVKRCHKWQGVDTTNLWSRFDPRSSTRLRQAPVHLCAVSPTCLTMCQFELWINCNHGYDSQMIQMMKIWFFITYIAIMWWTRLPWPVNNSIGPFRFTLAEGPIVAYLRISHTALSMTALQMSRKGLDFWKNSLLAFHVVSRCSGIYLQTTRENWVSSWESCTLNFWNFWKHSYFAFHHTLNFNAKALFWICAWR